jgi:glucose/arabinose dehydrogenase
VPAVEMQAHSAPLGLAFYTGDQFPAQFKGDLFVAFHGSWNRSVPTGYKVVRIRFANNQPDQSAGDLMVEDFATGWLEGGVFGRPVNPMVAPDGSLLLTDDEAGAIYSIYYQENAGP